MAALLAGSLVMAAAAVIVVAPAEVSSAATPCGGLVLAPTVTSVSPDVGPTTGNQSVTVTGTCFLPSATTVTFGAAGNGTNVLVNTDGTSLTVTSPSGSAGTVDVTATTAGGTSATSSADQYTYGKPAVSGLSPTGGTTCGGTTVIITGTGFVGASGVTFGSTPAQSFTVNSATQISAVSPPEVAGTVHVTVSNAQGTSTTVSTDQFTYVTTTTPTVASVAPNVGPTAGGQSVTVTGSCFTPDASVTFGGAGSGTAVSVNASGTSLTVTTPAGSAGTVDVTVTTADGTSAVNSPADQYTFQTGPAVSGVSPSAGPLSGHTAVTITGTGFTGASAVMFGATSALTFTVNSDTSISATSPAGSAGQVDVKVTTPGGTSATAAGDKFTYVAAPTVTGVSPAVGPTSGGTVVTITGTGFSGTGWTSSGVNFGGTAATTFTVVNATSITATSPAGSAGTVDVTVTTPGGTSATSANDKFTYVAAPTITNVTPASGPVAGGTSVTITGTGFSGAGWTTSAVSFGGTAATTFTVNSATSITATSPAGSAGTVDITATTPGGTSSTGASDQFTYAAAPTVTSVSPTTGPLAGGTSVTITGTGFSGTGWTTSAVSFGGTAATTFTVNSATQITATAPAHAAGAVDVTVTTPGGTSATGTGDKFTYVAAPTITNISPTAGTTSGGTVVTITGTGFSGTGWTTSAVAFGGIAATTFTVNSATQITATTPAHAAGAVDVTATTPGGTATDAGAYSYVAPVPTVTGVSPSAGPVAGGTSVTLTGTGFVGATAVKFGSTAATTFTVNSATQITATSPAESAGTVDVTVTTAGGTSSTGAADQFVFVPAPAITSVSPASGPTAGGTSVIITGTGFSGTGWTMTAVHFGATGATTFTVNSATQITATSPAEAAGVVDITVTTPGGTSATGAGDQFTFAGPPTVTSLAPSNGPLGGGTVVTITGTGFGPPNDTSPAVSFGGTPATAVTWLDSTHILATSPAHAAGTVDVIVTTSVGGASSAVAGDHFTYVPGPTVTAVSPTSGSTSGGTSVTITGTNFSGTGWTTTSVSFGATAATNFTVNSATQITATAPAHAAGTVDVTVTTAGGTSATGTADNFTYVPPPTVSAVNPANGPAAGGTPVTITGTNLTGATAVHFGTTAVASFTVVNATTITTASPAGAPGTVDVTVTTPYGTSAASAADQFTYVARPTVTAVSPANGPATGGTVVTITGTGFGAPNNGSPVVSFGPNAATHVTVNSATQITATSPSGSGVVDVTVATSVGGVSAANAADHFTYVPAPTVTAVSPSSGPTAGGTSVTITGTNFSGSGWTASAVKFGTSAAASFTVNSTTQITASDPAQAQGIVDVTVTTPGGTSATGTADHFSYLAPAPTISGVSPSSGPSAGGTNVTITGTGFTGTTAVHFGTAAATGVTVVDDSHVAATSPAGSAGSVDVTVTTAGGTSATNAGDRFTYVPPPSVSGVVPNTGPPSGGTAVTISGSNFSGASAVAFGNNAAASFTVVDPTTITAVSPAGALGTVDVVVTTVGGTNPLSASDQFTYAFGPVSATGAFPSGVVEGYGPQTVGIFGSGFHQGLTVTAANAGLSISVIKVTGSQITLSVEASPASIAAAAAGPTDLTVHNPDGGTAIVHGFLVGAPGYYTVTHGGHVHAFGSVSFFGDLSGRVLNKPIVGMAATPSGHGYWLVASDGGIFTFGDAPYLGSTGGLPLNKPIVGMAPTPTGHGYWLVASDGGIFTFGDAAFLGSTGGLKLNKPVVGMAPTRSGNGYWLVATDGGIFTFGDAGFFGSTGGLPLNKPVNGMSPTPSGHGYWLVASDGGIFTFGDAPFVGSLGSYHLNAPIVGMAPGLTGAGYYLLGADGGVFTFNVPFFGSSPNEGTEAAMADAVRFS